jgi:hypothetical protein
MTRVAAALIVTLAATVGARSAPAIWKKDEAVSACKTAAREKVSRSEAIKFDDASLAISQLRDNKRWLIGWSLSVAFTVPASRGSEDMNFTAVCEALDGRELRLLGAFEREALDDLLSNQTPERFRAIARRVVIEDAPTSTQSRERQWSGAVKNANTFGVREITFDCREIGAGGRALERFPLLYDDVIAPGATRRLKAKLSNEAASAICSLDDLRIVGVDEQRLISAIGPDAGPKKYAELRAQAVQYRLSLEALLGPFLDLIEAGRRR